MGFVPPASVRRVCDPRWRRFVVMDGGGHFWTGTTWTDNPADAMLFIRESDAMRSVLHVHDGVTATFTTSLVISVGRGEWSVEDLRKYLADWGRFLLMKSQEARTVQVTIHWDGLEEDDRPSK